MPSSSVATPSSEYTSVVDLTRDGAAKNLAASHSQPESREGKYSNTSEIIDSFVKFVKNCYCAILAYYKIFLSIFSALY